MQTLERTEIRSIVHETIASVKPDVDPRRIADSDSLFVSHDPSSPVALDSLDGLDLAFSLADRFGLELEEDINPAAMATVEQIVDLIWSRLQSRTGSPALSA